jgi:hypothetical protein
VYWRGAFSVSLIRSICVVLFCFLLMPTAARSGDYVVAWAFDGGDKNETGTKADCIYRDYCTIKLKKFDFEVTIMFRRREYSVAIIRISHGIRCCYFSQGERSVERGTDSLIRLGVFEGRARKGNEFVLNAPVGQLFLLFSDLK